MSTIPGKSHWRHQFLGNLVDMIKSSLACCHWEKVWSRIEWHSWNNYFCLLFITLLTTSLIGLNKSREHSWSSWAVEIAGADPSWPRFPRGCSASCWECKGHGLWRTCWASRKCNYFYWPCDLPTPLPQILFGSNCKVFSVHGWVINVIAFDNLMNLRMTWRGRKCLVKWAKTDVTLDAQYLNSCDYIITLLRNAVGFFVNM